MKAPITVYLDTCIVSGIAKMDLSDEELVSLGKILDRHKKGEIEMVTSPLTKSEIDQVPDKFRLKHNMIYSLLSDLQIARHFKQVSDGFGWGSSGFNLGWGGTRRRYDPIYKGLSQILPDKNDAMHIFQAEKSQMSYFLTADRRTILRYKPEIETICSLKVVDSVGLLHILEIL